MSRRARRETEPTQRIRPFPRDKDAFWSLSLEQQQLLVAYVDDAPLPAVQP